MNPISFLIKAPWAIRTTLTWVVVFFVWGFSDIPDWTLFFFWAALVAVIVLAIKTRRYIWAVPIWGDIERRRNKGEFPGWLIRNADKEHHQILNSLRKIWEPMTIQTGLTKGDEENRRIPKVVAIRSEPRGPILTVRPATGGSVDEWENKAGALTSALAKNALVRASEKPGYVELQLETADPLAGARAAQLPEGWTEE